MVYVFGIEGVPLFEMLFMFMLLMLFGLVLVIFELKRLVKIISEEKEDIGRFETDIAQFEKDERMLSQMENYAVKNLGKKSSGNEVTKFIMNSRRKGIPDAEIKKMLIKAGWKEDKINKSF